MLRPGQAIALCVLALLTIGVVMVNSAGMGLDPKEAVTIQSILLSQSTAYMGLALLAMGVCSMLPVRALAAWAGRAEGGGDRMESQATSGWRRLGALLGPPGLWVGAAGLLALLTLVYVPGVGRHVNGSHRWISIAGLSLQPSEFAKWGMVGLMAWYCVRRADVLGRFWTGLVPALAAAGAVAGFIVLEDLGTGVLIGLVACVLLIAGGAKVWQLVLPAPLAALGLVAAVATSEYRMRRLTAFLDPYADPQKTGYHMIQSMLAVANGKVFGRGLGHGLQKFGYLPEDRTDFLFAVICEELGVAGATLVVALYVGLLCAAYMIVRREREPVLKLVGLGVMATVGLQAFMNLAVVTGVGPTKGIALPMLSAGGTGWILTAASLGMLVAMDRGSRRAERAELGAGAIAEPKPGEVARQQSSRAAEEQIGGEGAVREGGAVRGALALGWFIRGSMARR